jgi:hypothetical protein
MKRLAIGTLHRRRQSPGSRYVRAIVAVLGLIEDMARELERIEDSSNGVGTR